MRTPFFKWGMDAVSGQWHTRSGSYPLEGEGKSVTKQKFGFARREQVVAFLGSALVYFGLFAPALDVPIFGSLSYCHYANAELWIVLALLFATVVLAALKRTPWLWATGLGCGACISYTALGLWQNARGAQEEIRTRLAGNAFQELAQATLNSVQVEWGWTVLIAGTMCIVAAAAMSDPDKGGGHAG